jgi:hypothetical protein
MYPIFDVGPGVGILAVQSGKFHNDISKFEAFEMEKLDDATLLDLHRTNTFQFFWICAVVSPAIFSRGDPRLSHNPSIPRNFKWAEFGLSSRRRTSLG